MFWRSYPWNKSEAESQADFEGGVLKGDGADSGGGLEIALSEYDTCVGAYSFGGVVVDLGPFAGGIFPKGLG